MMTAPIKKSTPVLLGALLALFACSDGPSEDAPRRTNQRLFDTLESQPNRGPEDPPLLLTPIVDLEAPQSSKNPWITIPLPWPMSPTSNTVAVVDDAQTTIYSSEAEATDSRLRLIRSKIVREVTALERSEGTSVRDENTQAARIVVPPGETLECSLPPLIEGARATIIAHAESSPGTQVQIHAGRQILPASKDWRPHTARLEPSFGDSQLRIRCEAMGPGRAEALLVVKRIEIQGPGGDHVLIPSERSPLATDDGRRIHKLQYAPLPPPARLSFESSSPKAVGGEKIYLRKGTAYIWSPESLEGASIQLNGAPQLPTANSNSQLTLSPGSSSDLFPLSVPRSDLYDLEVEGLPSWILFQPEAALASRGDKDRVPEPFKGSDRLHRIDVDGERRIAMLLFASDEMSFPLPAEPGPVLTFSLASLRLDGEGEEPFSTLSVLLRQPDGQETQLADDLAPSTDRRWSYFRIPLPEASVKEGEIVFRTDGQSFRVDPEGKLLHHALALSAPTLIDPSLSPGGVLLYVEDTLRADHVQLYGYERDTTPELCAVESSLVIFENAYSNSSWTRPSTASILTGLHPGFHGAYGQNVLESDIVTLAEHFRRHGYATGAIVTNPNVSAKGLGFEEGFDTFREMVGREGEPFDVGAERLHPWISEWLDQNRHTPYFLYVHSIDPHSPYTPEESEWRRYDPTYEGTIHGGHQGEGNFESVTNPSREDIEHIVALYDAEIRYNDRWIGKLFDELRDKGLWDKTSFVFTSDHGEEFHEHGKWLHGERAWEELIHVPLVIKPRSDWNLSPRRLYHRTQLTDLAPTLCELEGLDSTGPFSGESLVSVLRQSSPDDPERTLYFDELPVLHSMMRGPLKGISYQDDRPGKKFLFHLVEDPRERHDHKDSRPDALSLLEEAMDRFYDPYLEQGFVLVRGAGRYAVLSPEAIDRLMQIGYLK